jgi:hypothetical protein
MSKSILRLVTASAFLAFGFLVTGAPAGADEKEAAADVEADIKTALEKLPEADRTAALAQRWCAIEQGNRLGSMGTPTKVMLDGKPVFLCCGGCKKKAAADAKRTIKAAETLRKVNAALGKLSPADRNLAEAQRFCAVMEDSRLGSMGTPVKVLIDGKPVFLCCKACEEEAQANPKDTVAKVAQLKKAHSSN